MNWGKCIIVAFVLFAGFIATLVTVCMRQEVSLVSKEYYKEELAYQEHIVRINNANDLIEKPIIKGVGDFIEVDFNQFDRVEKGELKLFRPSDSNMDKSFPIPANEASKQIFSVKDLHPGLYRARMSWIMNGKEYYIETSITL